MQVRQANLITDYGYNILAMLATHDTLVRFSPDLQPLPQLAESWESSPDGARWTFRIRRDARWHDGAPVTPEDVKFTFEYLGERNSASAWIKDLVKDITVDGQAVTFELTKPYSPFLINGGFIVRILPKHIWKDITDPFQPGDAAIAVGCGPFRLDGFDPDGGVVRFRRSPDYYGDASAVERLEILTGRSFDALTLSLARGDVDVYYKYASGFSAPHLPRLKENKHLLLHRADSMGVPAALGFNLKRSPVSSLAFRRALALALDYGKMARGLLGEGGGMPTDGFVPPAFPFHLAMEASIFSPDESRRELDAAGFVDSDGDGIRNLPGGGNIALTLLTRSDLEGMDALLPIIIHDLEQVGITAKVERTDLSTWVVDIREGRYDMAVFRATPWGMLMDAGCGSGYFDSRRAGGGVLANVDDPAFHALCDRILATTDPDALLRLQHEMQRYYAENLPALALCWAVNVYPALDSWDGCVINQVEGGLINRQTLTALRRAPQDR
jgi:peptide/nickel transport system substrate-binding protein